MWGRIIVAVLLALLPGMAGARAPLAWAPAWSAPQQQLGGDARLPDDQLTDATLRQSVRLSIGGRRIRMVLSNQAGLRPLAIAGVHVALSGAPGMAAIDPRSDHRVSFAGRSAIVIPAGGRVVSDAVDLAVAPLARLSISIHFAGAPDRQTGHLRSLSTSWLAHGDQLAAATLSAPVPVDHWYQIAAILVEAADPRVIVAFGDSITDGSRSTPNANARWPDILAARLQSSRATSHWAVANAGIAGNQLLADGYGEAGIARFDRDGLAQPHARTVVLLEGINDLGQLALKTPSPVARQALVADIVEAYARLICRAHTRGLRIVGATLTPFIGSDYKPTPQDEAARQAINRWIRAHGHFDAVIDWDALLRDPADPGRLRPDFDSGDHLHPSSAGYRAMADALPIADLVR